LRLSDVYSRVYQEVGKGYYRSGDHDIDQYKILNSRFVTDENFMSNIVCKYLETDFFPQQNPIGTD